MDALVEHRVSKCVPREGKTMQAFRRMPARKTKEKKLHMHTYTCCKWFLIANFCTLNEVIRLILKLSMLANSAFSALFILREYAKL